MKCLFDTMMPQCNPWVAVYRQVHTMFISGSVSLIINLALDLW